MYRQSEKNLLSSNISYMSSQYGELRPTSRWDRFVSLGHPCTFQLVSRLGSVTARHSSSGCQPNFAALNRGRHLCSAGRPSGWALAHILVLLHMLVGIPFYWCYVVEYSNWSVVLWFFRKSTYFKCWLYSCEFCSSVWKLGSDRFEG